MKKSTLLKIISMVLIAATVLSFASCFNFGGGNSNTATEDDSEKATVYLDPNGGKLPEDQSDELKVTIGENFPKLPEPTRLGYNFLGWFEDGDEKYEVSRRTRVDKYHDGVELVALWEAAGTIYSVEFSLLPDEIFLGDNDYFEVVGGQKISSILDSLPAAEKDGYKFNGWKDQNNNTVTKATTITGDLVLTPKWTSIVYCLDGTENHQWNAWQESSEATCTDPAQSSRLCSVCGHTEYNITQEALGHKFGNWAITNSENGLVRSRICVECDEKEADPLNNIAYDSFKTPVVDGDIWGTAPGPNLFDKDYEMNNTKSFAGKGTGAIVVTTEAKESTYVDIIAVTGYGSSAYNVVVTFDDGTEKDLGLGSFGSGDGATKPFNVGANITKIVVTMPTCSIGSDYWVELSILVVPQ
jgi:uncharacterized repeat protein (TIGR02543 family)